MLLQLLESVLPVLTEVNLALIFLPSVLLLSKQTLKPLPVDCHMALLMLRTTYHLLHLMVVALHTPMVLHPMVVPLHTPYHLLHPMVVPLHTPMVLHPKVVPLHSPMALPQPHL